jgi:hypothetical protein
MQIPVVCIIAKRHFFKMDALGIGYFDGFNGKVAIVPIVDTPQSSFTGQEYLGLYPYVDEATATNGQLYLWINHGKAGSTKPLQNWLQAA